MALVFGAAICALSVAVASSLLALRARGASAERLAHTAANRLAIEELASALVVSHATIDAYVGTGEERHRRRHLRAVARLESRLAEVVRLAEGEPAEQAELEQLRPAVRRARAEQLEALSLADAGNLPSARALRARGAGSEALERAQEALGSLKLHETREAEHRQLGWSRSVATSNAVFLVAAGILLLLLLLTGRIVREEIRARQEKEVERERALAVQKRLMAVVSHDLRNPLSGILAAGWSLSRAGLGPDHERLARRVVSAGRRMERLIRDLLDWSRVHGGMEIPVSLAEGDLHEVCLRIAGELGDPSSDRIRIEREGNTRALFDADRMEQVVANLVGNALKYSPPEAPVRVRVVGEPEKVRLEVRDEGPGIPPGTRAELFEPFRRARSTGTGLGLGLFIVRTLVEAQGARIEADSGSDRGTTFVVHVPRVR